jgi:hypothetical protein
MVTMHYMPIDVVSLILAQITAPLLVYSDADSQHTCMVQIGISMQQVRRSPLAAWLSACM